jgi:hypothetical protein
MENLNSIVVSAEASSEAWVDIGCWHGGREAFAKGETDLEPIGDPAPTSHTEET